MITGTIEIGEMYNGATVEFIAAECVAVESMHILTAMMRVSVGGSVVYESLLKMPSAEHKTPEQVSTFFESQLLELHAGLTQG